jgi:hypothetical protein
MRRVRVTKERLYSKEREEEHWESQKKGDRTAEKHRETERLCREK